MTSDAHDGEAARKLRSLNTIVSGDGRETEIVLDVVDGATKAPQPPIRCVTDQQGLSLMIAKFMQSARIARDKIAAADGAPAPHAERQIQALHFRSGVVGLSTEKTTVTLEIQTFEGPTFAFALDPASARQTAEHLLKMSRKAKTKAQLN
jgi:hypothetical protein